MCTLMHNTQHGDKIRSLHRYREQMRAIDLETALAEMVLIVEHPGAVKYRNCIGDLKQYAEMEGVLVPLGFHAEIAERIQHCMQNLSGPGISKEVGDTLDAILASSATAKSLKVDRTRQHESCYRWFWLTHHLLQWTNFIPNILERFTGLVMSRVC